MLGATILAQEPSPASFAAGARLRPCPPAVNGKFRHQAMGTHGLLSNPSSLDQGHLLNEIHSTVKDRAASVTPILPKPCIETQRLVSALTDRTKLRKGSSAAKAMPALVRVCIAPARPVRAIPGTDASVELVSQGIEHHFYLLQPVIHLLACSALCPNNRCFSLCLTNLVFRIIPGQYTESSVPVSRNF